MGRKEEPDQTKLNSKCIRDKNVKKKKRKKVKPYSILSKYGWDPSII